LVAAMMGAVLVLVRIAHDALAGCVCHRNRWCSPNYRSHPSS
jgi:hypothetical protein